MIRSRVFVFLAIALFLAGWSSAEATSAPAAEGATEATATEKVTELQAFTARVLEKAKKKFNDAESTKSDVESQKTKADNAESDVRTAAAAIKEKDRKTQADTVVKTAGSELEKCNTLYNTVKAKADQASESLDVFVKRARALVQSAQIDIPAASSQSANYEQVIQSAAAVTGRTTTLSGEIEKSKVLSEVDIALSELKDSAKKIQVLKYQAESLVTVSNIEAKLTAAETYIQSIQQKEKDIDAIVQDMTAQFQSASDASTSVLSSLCSNARGYLQTATKKVKEAQQCSKEMQGRKTELDKDLETLKATTDQSDAGKEAKKFEWHKKFIDGEIEKITQALRAADISLSNAKNVQQQMQNEMSKDNSQPRKEPNKVKTVDNVPTEEVTTPIQNAEEKLPVIPDTEKPTIIKAEKPEIPNTDKPVLPKTPNPSVTKTDTPAKTDAEKPEVTETDKPEKNDTEKPIFGNSKDTMDKTSEQPVDTNLDSTEQNKSTQLTDQQKQNPKDDNSELLNKDQLRNITKDITNNPLIGGEVPTRSAANDSAVTVFIPLLVILVISAVLH